MSRYTVLLRRYEGLLRRALTTFAAGALFATPMLAQVAQKQDAEYTARIKAALTDPRITTELVDHLPASDKVPTPLKFHGRIIGEVGNLTRSKELHAYLKAIADAAPTRAKYWSIGKTEEGRDIVVLVVANEETIRNLNVYKGYLAELTDPRKTTESRAQTLLKTAKPIYWLTSGMHSTETGGPEMLQELAYRLVVEETPFIKSIRDNVITIITPLIEPDGRDKIVDGCYFAAKNPGVALPTPYWGKYVAHDNNRDGMGQFLALTKSVTRFGLEWHPTVLHDLHEQAQLLYVSTGMGPYNEGLDPITVQEWWWMAQNDVMEMTKRGVPGVWTYGFYDGWTPNYMFYVVHAHNAVGRFYEVATYRTPQNFCTGSATATAAAGRGGAAAAPAGRGAQATTLDTNTMVRVLGGNDYQQSREWYRPNPRPNDIVWGPRANTNIQQSGVLFALWNMAKERERFLENYWIKNKNAVNKGKYAKVKAWVIPAGQHSKQNAAEAVNALIAQGVEFHIASADVTVAGVPVKRGDWIIRGDQPFRTVADIYFSIQNYPTTNPAPYDDTGWTFQMMRNIVVREITERSFLISAMTPVTGNVTATGGVIGGTGNTLIVDHTGDNNMVTLRFRFPTTQMAAAEAKFDAAGHSFGAGSYIIANANRAELEPALRELGLSAWAVAAAPSVRTHNLDVPRIGYIHSWTNTQDEGWVRAALDHYKIPYTYFGENEVRKIGANLRQRFDVILWPHGGSAAGGPVTGGVPIPYKRSAEFQALGTPDSTDDTRGGMGEDGLKFLYQFAQAGGTIITEGGTAAIFPRYNLTPGLTLQTQNPGLVADGTILRGVISDPTSPIVYGYGVNHLPIYFDVQPVFSTGQAPVPTPPLVARGGPQYQNISPMATKVPHATWDPFTNYTNAPPPPDAAGGGGAAAPGARGGAPGGRGAGAASGTLFPELQPRVVVSFAANPADLLLSGVLAGGENLAARPNVVTSPVGQGHIVMFAIRPFWRWQTQGTFNMGFNAIVNWNDLGAR